MTATGGTIDVPPDLVAALRAERSGGDRAAGLLLDAGRILREPDGRNQPYQTVQGREEPRRSVQEGCGSAVATGLGGGLSFGASDQVALDGGSPTAVALVHAASSRASPRLRTSNPRIYAAGEVASLSAFTHLAGVQALPSGGSLSRTGVAVSAGARTRWTGVISGVFLALVVLLLGSLAERIPMSVIGGLILVIGGELIWGKRRDIVLVWHTSWLSTVAMVVTFLATTQLPLQQAITLGAVLSLLLYCAQAARHADFTGLVWNADGAWTVAPIPEALSPRQVTVLAYERVSLFAELPALRAKLPKVDGARASVLVLAVRAAPDVPSSAMIKLLRDYAADLHGAGGRLILAGVQPDFAALLTRTGLTDQLGHDSVLIADPVLLSSVERAVAEAETWIAAQPATT
jgi:SulP family sulfate permease